jgi:hypothetical protein
MTGRLEQAPASVPLCQRVQPRPGHVPPSKVSKDRRESILDLYNTWNREAEAANDTAALRLVARRLNMTSSDRDPMNGHFPLYLGHVSEFDEGVVPRAVVTDSSYFVDWSRSDASA